MSELTAPPDLTTREDGEVPDLLASLPKESLATTLSRLSAFYKRFVYHPDESTYDLMALWAAHTHSMQTWRATPRLFIVSPEPGCGKTTQLEAIKFASRSGIRAASSSAAGLFSIVTTRTVFLDETDNLFTSHSERGVLRGVVNDGYLPDGFVLRKDGPVPVYGALAFAGIENGTMPGPTRQRCIPVRMRVGEPAEMFDPYDHIAYHDELAARFGNHAERWSYVKPTRNNRNNLIWSPLHSVTAAAGGDWPKRAQRAQEVHQWPVEANEQKAILSATRDWFEENRVDRVASQVLADYLTAYDSLPRMTGKSLYKCLARGYGIEPQKISHSYYFRADLEPVWREWLADLA